MNLTQNEQCFLEILRAALQGRTLDASDFSAETDWDYLVSAAANHKLLPMFLSTVPVGLLPDGRALKQHVLRQVMVQTKNSIQFLRLFDKMHAAGLRPLVVKGIVCRGLYPQGELRPSGDEDLYVTDEDFGECCRILREYGMEPDTEEGPDVHEIGWRKQGSALYIELHRRLFPPEARAYGDLQAFFDRSHDQAVEYTTEFGIPVLSMSPHDHMLYLILHAYKHFLHSGFGIRQVCDIGLWARKYHEQIDWELLAAQCGGCNVRTFAAAVLGIARYYLDITIPPEAEWAAAPEFCEPMLIDILLGGIYGAADRDRQYAATVTLNAVAADRAGTRHSIWASVFLKRSSMEGKYPYLKKYPFLLPIAWIQRIWQYLNKHSNAGDHLSASITIGNERIRLLKLYGIIE